MFLTHTSFLVIQYATANVGRRLNCRSTTILSSCIYTSQFIMSLSALKTSNATQAGLQDAYFECSNAIVVRLRIVDGM